MQVGAKITDRLEKHLKKNVNSKDPEYWGLAAFINDEMAEMGLLMKKRRPYTADELVKMSGKSKDEVIRIMGEMS